jgi:hypothetical protein
MSGMALRFVKLDTSPDESERNTGLLRRTIDALGDPAEDELG